MTLISGARIAEKRHSGAGCVHDCPNRWVFSRRWNVFSDRLLSRSADGRLFSHCGFVEGEAAPTHRRLHSWQVDTSSRCRPQSRTFLNLVTEIARRNLADMAMWRRGCICIRGPQSWKWSFAAPEGCVGYEGLEWCGPDMWSSEWILSDIAYSDSASALDIPC